MDALWHTGPYAPSEGHVLLDGVDMRQIDLADLRRHVSLSGQQPRLLFGTLRENLDPGRADRLMNDEELIVALRRFGLDKLVRAHPLGLDMPIGEDGHGLSGGLAGLARLTLQAVTEWAREKTMVVVIHRPQVLPFVQRVVVIDQGRIVADGPRDAVLQRLAKAAAGAAPAASVAPASPPGAGARPRVARVMPMQAQAAGPAPAQDKGQGDGP